MAVANTRHIRIRPTEDDEVTVPKDVADLLGPEAELEMGSGQVTIRRSGKLARQRAVENRKASQDGRGASGTGDQTVDRLRADSAQRVPERMKPADVPAGAVVVDTDVVSWLALREARAEEFAALLAGRELFISFATLAEVRTFLAMHVLEPDFHELLTKALDNYAVLPVNTEELVRRWVALRAATVNNATADDRERRQNDTWIAASALSADPSLPLATGNLRDFRPLADASDLKLIHPDI